MSRYRKSLTEAYKEVLIKEQNKDHEISMARGELEAIADKALKLSSMLQGKTDEGNPLEAWVQSKITKAKDYINSVSDYMKYTPDMAMESHGPKIFTNDKGSIEKVGDKFHTYKGDKKSVHDTLDDAKLALNETPQGYALVQKAKEIAKKFANNYTKAVDEIEKLEKGLSKNSTVEKELLKYNESLEEADNYPTKDMNDKKHSAYNDPKKGEKKVVDPEPKISQTGIEETSLKAIFTANQEGQKIDDIAKKLKMSVSDVKKILGEETINEFKKMTVTFKTHDQMSKASTDLAKQGFTIDAKGLVMKVDGKGDDLNKYATDMKNFYGATVKAESYVNENFNASQIARLKKEYEVLRGKKISVDNANKLSKMFKNIPDSGLVDLYKADIPFLSTMAMTKMIQKNIPRPAGVKLNLGEKKLTVKKGDKVREINDFEWRTYSQMGYKLVGKDGEVMKEDRYEGARSLVETIKGLQNKAKKTGMPYSILKKVYDRGMAAWKGGHRPGASQQQWAFARVNSFVTKSSGTWGGADKDLADKVRGSKK